jgi:DNA-3-methyladenine glycosylase II
MDGIRLAVEAPFSLALTVGVLQRMPTNIVDQWADGCWTRGPLRVRQLDEHTLWVSPATEVPLVRHVLGLDVSPGLLVDAVAAEPRLLWLAERFAGLRPPRYPTLFEAIGMTIPFQQVSLAAGQSIANALVRRFGVPAWVFPAPEAIAAASPEDLRACGLSAAKARTLQTVARLVVEGHFVNLEALPSQQVLQALDAVPGIGPWTAAVIALRGLGRLDVFPPGDVGARRTLAHLLGQPAPLTAAEEAELIARLGQARGLVYFLGLAYLRSSRST